VSVIYIVALFCLEPSPRNPYSRAPAPIETPACLQVREEYRGTIAECWQRGIAVHQRRMAKLQDKPFQFAGMACQEVKRGND
jgi:hypothetical protein